VSVLLLVRHGQASFGKADYDALSDLGHRQSQLVGRALAARGVEPALVVTGAMRRHRESLENAVAAAGWSAPTDVDEGWNEFDHEHVIAVHKPAYRSPLVMKADLARTLAPRRAFQEVFEAATARWTGGEFDDDYTESFAAFTGRVTAALSRTTDALAPRQTAVVFTSGGPIAAATAALLSPSAATSDLWARLNLVMVNTGVTKIVVGGRRPRLVSFNDHSHLEAAAPGLITYR
jgi:broad specificity phosphatase PhoE